MTRKMVYRWLALASLVAIGAQRYTSMTRPAAVMAYQQNIRAVAGTMPRQIEAWISEDVPVPAQAIEMLSPNVMISRRYVNVETGEAAGMFIVHCADAHDMAGHFPLRCYPANGWQLQSAQPRDWSVDGVTICGTEYGFSKSRMGHDDARIVVVNFLLRPDGQILRDMDAMAASIIGAGGQASGAGQVQVYFDGSVPQERRDAATRILLDGYKPLLDAMLRKIQTETGD